MNYLSLRDHINEMIQTKLIINFETIGLPNLHFLQLANKL